MELVSAYMKKARNWDIKRVNYLPGAYGLALKKIYGDAYIHVDLYANRKAYYERQNKKQTVNYKSELF